MIQAQHVEGFHVMCILVQYSIVPTTNRTHVMCTGAAHLPPTPDSFQLLEACLLHDARVARGLGQPLHGALDASLQRGVQVAVLSRCSCWRDIHSRLQACTVM
jgi:hypothetical protein